MELKLNLDIDTKKLKEDIDKESYVVPEGFTEQQVKDKVFNYVLNRNVIEKSIQHILNNYAEYKQYTLKDYGVDYYVQFPGAGSANQSNELIIRQYSTNDYSNQKVMVLPMEAMSYMKFIHEGTPLNLGNITITDKEEDLIISKLYELGVFESEKPNVNVRVKNMGTLVKIYSSYNAATIITVDKDEYGYTFFKTMYSIKQQRYLYVESMRIVNDFAKTLITWFNKEIEEQKKLAKKMKDNSTLSYDLEIAKLKDEIKRLEKEKEKFQGGK